MSLTGTIAWIRIVEDPKICALVWGVISAILLFCLALPPSFAEFAILGYIDFVSIIIAILITIIATGVEASNAPGGLGGVDWSLWPPADMTFHDAFLSTTNIIFAYSFAVCQYRSVVYAPFHTETSQAWEAETVPVGHSLSYADTRIALWLRCIRRRTTSNPYGRLG